MYILGNLGSIKYSFQCHGVCNWGSVVTAYLNAKLHRAKSLPHTDILHRDKEGIRPNRGICRVQAGSQNSVFTFWECLSFYSLNSVHSITCSQTGKSGNPCLNFSQSPRPCIQRPATIQLSKHMRAGEMQSTGRNKNCKVPRLTLFHPNPEETVNDQYSISRESRSPAHQKTLRLEDLGSVG